MHIGHNKAENMIRPTRVKIEGERVRILILEMQIHFNSEFSYYGPAAITRNKIPSALERLWAAYPVVVVVQYFMISNVLQFLLSHGNMSWEICVGHGYCDKDENFYKMAQSKVQFKCKFKYIFLSRDFGAAKCFFHIFP